MLYSSNDALEIVRIASAELDANSNALVANCKSAPMSEDLEDAADMGSLCVYGVSGITNRPYPEADGHCEGIVSRSLGVVIASRDTRTSSIYGSLKEGDTAVHSTDPDEGARILLKGADKIASVIVKNSSGKMLVLSMDGDGEAIQILDTHGNFYQMNEDGFSLGNGSANMTFKSDGTIQVCCGKMIVSQAPTLPIPAVNSVCFGPGGIAPACTAVASTILFVSS